jgi:hypothetical protein
VARTLEGEGNLLYLDFMGTGELVNPGVLLVYWVGTILLLILAVLGRRRQAWTR